MSQKSPLQRTQFIMMFFAFAFGMIFSSLLNHFGKEKASNAAHKEILFIYRGTEKYSDDVVQADRQRLKALAREKLAIVKNAALRQYFMDEADKTNTPLDQLVQTRMPWAQVSEADVARYYENNKDKLDKPLSEVYPQIQAVLERERLKQAKEQLLNQLIKEGNLALLPLR